MQPWVAITVACITTTGGIIVAVIQKFRRENHRDHGLVMDALKQVSHTINRVEGKVDSHIDWHLKEAGNGRVTRRNSARGRKAS
jgi:hypothetical protein